MVCKDIKTIRKILTGLVLVTLQLELIETGEDADYTGVIDELRWNKMILENRLKNLQAEVQK